MQQYLKKIRQRLFPRTLIIPQSRGVKYLESADGGWRETSADSITDVFFGQEILLVPDRLTLFSVRSFPQTSVKQSELQEAIELDFDLWSPWGAEVDYYFWPTRIGEKWVVAVWLWRAAELDKLLGAVDHDPTHIIPERAWKIAVINSVSAPTIYIDRSETGELVYVELGVAKAPLRIAEIADETEARRFWNALDISAQNYSVLVDDSIGDDLWLAEPAQDIQPVVQGTPAPQALRYAKQPGVKDWTDPFTWVKPIAIVMALYLFWIVGNGVVLWKQGQYVADQVAEAREVAGEVLGQRNQVERAYDRLASLQRYRTQQHRLEQVLAALSAGLPKDAWLEIMDYNNADGGWIDLTGKAEQSTSLAAELEKMPEVRHAMFLTDIRKDARTGLEPFKIRLKLADEG